MNEFVPKTPEEKNENDLDYQIHFEGDLIEINSQMLSDEARIKLAYEISEILDPKFSLGIERSSQILSEGQPLRPDSGTYGITISSNGIILADTRNAPGDPECHKKLISAVEKVINSLKE